MSTKKSSDTIGNRTRDLLACSAVPQPTAPPCAPQLFIDLKKTYDSVRMEVLYNIPIESGIPMQLVELITMCLNETCSRVRVGKHLSDMFPIRNGLKQGDAFSPCFSTFL